MVVDKKKNTQILVTLPNEMLHEVEKYWHERKLKNRNEAIRKLVAAGLDSEDRQD